MSNLTETPGWTTPIPVADDGQPVTAGPAETGTERDALQALANRTAGMAFGVVSFKSLQTDGTGAAPTTPPAPGQILASSDIISNTSVAAEAAGATTMFPDSVVFTGTTHGANPVISTPLVNELRACNLIKCSGRFLTNGAGAPSVIAPGANWDGAAAPAGSAIQVSFAAPMDDANYIVVASGVQVVTGGPQDIAVTVAMAKTAPYAPTTGHFFLVISVGNSGGGNAVVDPTTGGLHYDISFMVMGVQTS